MNYSRSSNPPTSSNSLPPDQRCAPGTPAGFSADRIDSLGMFAGILTGFTNGDPIVRSRPRQQFFEAAFVQFRIRIQDKNEIRPALFRQAGSYHRQNRNFFWI
jgi:hypothetical protein